MGKLIKLKVLIVGCRGLGVECAKNLILAGPASVALYDPTIVSINDLGANFYLKESHVGKVSRAHASFDQLQELNPYVKVSVIETLTVEEHANYNVVCYTENFNNISHLFGVNAFCRANKVGFILAETLGLAGYAFLDYGDQHLVSDADGEPIKSFIVTSITNDEKAIVTVHEDKRHSYQEGDHVKFVEVEGMTEINNREPVEITQVKGPFAFQIKLDTKNWGTYTR
jgi:ubiquitin-activating enzyme E1